MHSLFHFLPTDQIVMYVTYNNMLLFVFYVANMFITTLYLLLYLLFFTFRETDLYNFPNKLELNKCQLSYFYSIFIVCFSSLFSMRRQTNNLFYFDDFFKWFSIWGNTSKDILQSFLYHLQTKSLKGPKMQFYRRWETLFLSIFIVVVCFFFHLICLIESF